MPFQGIIAICRRGDRCDFVHAHQLEMNLVERHPARSKKIEPAPVTTTPTAPPKEFQMHTWTNETNAKPGTQNLRKALIDLLDRAIPNYTDTGHKPRWLAFQDPTRILGPDWHIERDGTYGKFHGLTVVRDPRLGMTRFAISHHDPPDDIAPARREPNNKTKE